jgi:group I intron endonuclease
MNTYKDFPNKPDAGYGFIYFLRSPSGKAYVGQTTISITRRIQFHSWGGCRALHSAIEKYGVNNFFVGEVGMYPIADLDNMEVRFIKELCTLAPEGYNLTTGGGANHKCSDETRKRMSEAKREKPMSATNKDALLKANLGKPMPATTKAALLRANIGNHLSAETKQKIVLANTGKSHNAETRQRMSEAKKGKPKSAETKQRMSAAWKGKPKSEETKRKMSEGWRLRRLQKQEPLPLFQNL